MSEKYVLFGAGDIAESVIKLLGTKKIEYLVDNDSRKEGKYLMGLPVFYYESKKKEIKHGKTVVISVSDTYSVQISEQLKKDGVERYLFLSQVKADITKNRISRNPCFIEIYKKAIYWIEKHTLVEGSIICNTGLTKGYPEVTGYYIPTLIRWGYRDTALKYAEWLLQIQKTDGSWYDAYNRNPYIFDSAQVIKGLLAARSIASNSNKIDASIIKGCDWIVSRMNESGRLITPIKDLWGDEDVCAEIVHIYCLSPLIEAGSVLDRKDYIEAADKILEYYLSTYYDKLMNFGLLSHFYAYLMEALLDLGYVDMCRTAMDKIAEIQKDSGAVPAYNNVDWVCSTGLFQLSMVWYRLGDWKRAESAFEYACKLQNESGGWFGSYVSEDNEYENNTYFPTEEISWANKFFLDALYYRNKAEMDIWAPKFKQDISFSDGRYKIIEESISESTKRVVDLGCGKGRYLKNLIQKYPLIDYTGIDISNSVLKYVDDSRISVVNGMLSNIPFDDESFDLVYTCEALEHAVDIESSIREMARVLKREGIMIVIDKNDSCVGKLNTTNWEQWFNEQCLQEIMLKFCKEVKIIHGIDYEDMGEQELFSAWVGKK